MTVTATGPARPADAPENADELLPIPFEVYQRCAWCRSILAQGVVGPNTRLLLRCSKARDFKHTIVLHDKTIPPKLPDFGAPASRPELYSPERLEAEARLRNPEYQDMIALAEKNGVDLSVLNRCPSCSKPWSRGRATRGTLLYIRCKNCQHEFRFASLS